MSHTRKDDQKVDAFSAPKDLLAQAKQRADELKMTKSGFYRYCLAKMLGYSEPEARVYSEHRAVLNSIEATPRVHYPPLRGGAMIMHDKPSSKSVSSAADILDVAAKSVPNAVPKRKRKP